MNTNRPFFDFLPEKKWAFRVREGFYFLANSFFFDAAFETITGLRLEMLMFFNPDFVAIKAHAQSPIEAARTIAYLKRIPNLKDFGCVIWKRIP